MTKHYHHLTYEKRCQLEALLARGLSYREIGRQLGVDHTTISREIRRNISYKGYKMHAAHAKACWRQRLARSVPKKMTPDIINIIQEKIKLKWSPEQISGRLAHESIANISHTTIYQFIRKNRSIKGKLYQHLRHRGKKYRQLSTKTAGAGLIPGRIDIDQRPAIVDQKSRVGDWEADTIIGKGHKGAIFSCVERKTKYTKLAIMENKKSCSVLMAIIQHMLPIKHKITTITYDNGKEFAGHQTINKILDSESYFAKPYHSWHRALNEHTNGLVRQYLPKTKPFHNINQAEVSWVENQLNHRPRKSLNFLTPHEAFFSTSTKLVHLRL